MKKFAAMLMLVCSFGVFAVVGCGPEAKKVETPKADTKTPDKMSDTKTPETKTPTPRLQKTSRSSCSNDL